MSASACENSACEKVNLMFPDSVELTLPQYLDTLKKSGPWIMLHVPMEAQLRESNAQVTRPRIHCSHGP